jgi:hypothetical protein
MPGSYAREQLQDKTSSRNVYKEITYSWMARVLGFCGAESGPNQILVKPSAKKPTQLSLAEG